MVTLFIAFLRATPSHAQAVEDIGPSADRVVHRFDFDERASGNLEDVPKYWEPLRPAGFPRFAVGEFDEQFGRTAPPSFYLRSAGRCVAYQYTGPDTRVRANNDYRVEGYVRGDRLVSARACLSAHFLDRWGNALLTTLVRSPYIAESTEADGWTKIEVNLPPAPMEAYTIALTAWVMQKNTWEATDSALRQIPLTDVHAGAWFDDIAIHVLPRVAITTSSPGNVLVDGKAQELRVVLEDHEEVGLTGKVTINTVHGAEVETHLISVTARDTGGAVSLAVDHLPPGVYPTTVEVIADGKTILTRSLTFARAAPLHRGSDFGGRSFGINLDPRARGNPEAELDLLRNSAARSIKIPVWTGLPDDPPRFADKNAADRWLQELVKDGFLLTGVFWGPPSAIVRRDGAYPRSLWDLLAEKPEIWQESLATVVAPYASVYHRWQLGPDGWSSGAGVEKRDAGVRQLREVMRRFITAPLLMGSESTEIDPEGRKPPFEQLSLTIGGNLAPDEFATPMARWKTESGVKLAAYVEPLSAERYERKARLADWARRLLAARHAEAETVFVPQPWRVRETLHGPVMEPTEDFLILRTLGDILGNARPGQRIDLSATARCLVFHDGEQAVLALWDTAAPPEGNRYALQLGAADRLVRLFGEESTLERDDRGRQVVHLAPMPVLIDGATRRLIDFQSAVTLMPAHVELGSKITRLTLKLPNPVNQALSGQLRLRGPKSWEITPASFDFNLMPQRTQSFPMDVTFPHNQPAGTQQIRAELTMNDGIYMEVPLSVELGLADLEVRGMAVVEGRDLMLRQSVTNRSRETLHLRGAAIVPGRERQYRPMSNLAPGETEAVEYRFVDGRALIGTKVRVELRETNDGPRFHALELLIP